MWVATSQPNSASLGCQYRDLPATVLYSNLAKAAPSVKENSRSHKSVLRVCSRSDTAIASARIAEAYVDSQIPVTWSRMYLSNILFSRNPSMFPEMLL
jgi:hypothetical protein